MEKFSQFRDRGSGIAPFLPVSKESPGAYWPVHIFLFMFRLPIFFTLLLTYFLILQWLPIGALGKKAIYWLILGTPGIWWIDLQIDGVKRGSLSNNAKRIPQPGTIIAASRTSPLDALYLAAIFDPIFTASYPSTRFVRRISLLSAMLSAFSGPKPSPSSDAKLVDLPALLASNPHRAVVVFPECTTTNGRGILRFSPSLLTAAPTTKIFPISLRYTAPDITTPIPGTYTTFLWNLLSTPTHCIRVRIAEHIYRSSASVGGDNLASDNNGARESMQDIGISLSNHDDVGPIKAVDKRLLDKTGEALARLGRVKRVGLGVKEKSEFVRIWNKRRSQ